MGSSGVNFNGSIVRIRSSDARLVPQIVPRPAGQILQ